MLREEIGSLVQKEGGVLNGTDSLPKKSLTYPFKKRGGHLNVLSFQCNPEKLENLEKELKAEKRILRYLILAKKLPKKVVLAQKPRHLIKPSAGPILRDETRQTKPKVELKEIEKKLEEILKES